VIERDQTSPGADVPTISAARGVGVCPVGMPVTSEEDSPPPQAASSGRESANTETEEVKFFMRGL